MNSITSTALQRVDMERHEIVRLAGALLRADHYPLPRETVYEHVVQVMLASCIKQERWSRGQAA